VALPESLEQRCEQLYRDFDATVQRANRIDTESARVRGVPYLRADRFTASLKDRASEGPAFDTWLERLRALDTTAREYEWSNLPRADQQQLARRFPALGESAGNALDACGRTLARRDFSDARPRESLRQIIRIPDDYDTWKRVVGLYALTRIPFASGVRRYQSETLETFETDLGKLAQHGQLVFYGPARGSRADAAEIRQILSQARVDALGVPSFEPSALERLLDAYAPVYWIDVVDHNDRIGTVRLQERGEVSVDIAQPMQYRRLAYTRYGDQILVQLVYSVWLPARPRTGAFDLLGGHLDGITWRVTLAAEGVPLLYDSIHNCGCYQQFFPTRRMSLKPQPQTLDETAFVPQQGPELPDHERIWLRIASRTHYIERVLAGPQPDETTVYAVASDEALRSLPVSESATRSIFGAEGIVPGSERRERWLYWPMGVREPGAMREWGHHATAFIGRRHFDDADLIERYFEHNP